MRKAKPRASGIDTSLTRKKNTHHWTTSVDGLQSMNHFLGRTTTQLSKKRSVLLTAIVLTFITNSWGCRSALIAERHARPRVTQIEAPSPALHQQARAAQSQNQLAGLANQNKGPQALPPIVPGNHAVVAAGYGPAQTAGTVTQAGFRGAGSQGEHGNGCPCGMHGGSTYRSMYPEFATAQNCGPSDLGAVGPGYIDHQEYIFDGGDRPPRSRVRKDGSVVGLTPEDTILHYDVFNDYISHNADETIQHDYVLSDGTFVEPACRVPIYAPRFGAVRKITSVVAQDRVVGPHAALQPEGAGQVQEKLGTDSTRKRQQLAREDNVRLIEGLKERNRGVLVDDVLPTLGFSDALKPYEDLQLVRNGKLEETDRVKLKRSTAAAKGWASYEALQVIVDGQQAAVIHDAKSAAEVVLYEINGKPRVRICKVASHQIADPGDIIDFTLRFDNVGERVVGNIVIMDSLPPRLEYVENSQQCSLDAKFSTVANDAGSDLLRWEITDKVKPGDGGVVRFRCRVR